ncbi:MAG: OmpA family protein [Flavobacteriaceae bacterium]|nr:OmpA family protein [Flavobacteriaceae bacterium]
MKKLLAFLTFIAFLLLLWFAWNWYKNTVVCCPETVVEDKHGPLYFDCNSDLPITSKAWANKKSEILSAKADGKKLLITSPYFDGENKDMGLSRAKNIEKLFLDQVPDSLIVLNSQLAIDCEDAKQDALGKTMFRWVVRNVNVVEHHDKTYVYFKYNTDNPIDTENVVIYLDNLAEELISSGNSVYLTGHTDADGDQAYNEELGLKRANRGKAYLMKKEVPEDKIFVDSKGKLEPISDNTTEEGKQKNRRVEIVIK